MTLDVDDIPDSRAPYQVAKSELAAFKFKLIETVAADPRLSRAPCAAAIVVLASFVTIDKRTMKPTPAFASLVTMMARGGMKEKLARRARKLLEQEGYLVPTGSKTKDGCIKYRIENPHEERVQMHVREAIEYWNEQETERRAEERRKKLAKTHVGSPQTSTENRCGFPTGTHVGSPQTPNYLREYLSGYGSEEESRPIKVSSARDETENNPHQPYSAPESEVELTSMLATLFDGCQPSPAIMQAMRKMLIAGKLTPAIVEGQREFAS